jgi:hypothetical protein
MLNYQRVLGTCHRKSSGTFPGKKKFPEVPRDIPVKKSQKKKRKSPAGSSLNDQNFPKKYYFGKCQLVKFQTKIVVNAAECLCLMFGVHVNLNV